MKYSKTKVKIDADFCMIASEDGQQVRAGDMILVSRKIDYQKMLAAIIEGKAMLCKVNIDKGMIFPENNSAPIDTDGTEFIGTAEYLLRPLR